MEKIPDIIHPSWHPYLQKLFDDPKMKALKYDILLKCQFYPEAKNIFRVFAMPIDKIKVVILGQDPYPSPNEATGLAFAVNRTIKTPPSLQVIQAEILNSKVERDTQTNIETDKWKELDHWFKQGVFLLNTALTVEVKAAGSHLKLWEWFTREVITIISLHANHPIWLMWGAKAKGFIGLINGYLKAKTPDDFRGANYNYVFECDHPAAELYNGGKLATKFSGSMTFKACNVLLKLKGETIINW